jgi:hypothetical protein
MKEIPHEKYFYFSNGSKAGTIKELYNILSKMSKNYFKNYVNIYKNDFAAWIKYVFHENELAEKLSRTKSKKNTLEILKNYLNENIEKRDKQISPGFFSKIHEKISSIKTKVKRKIKQTAKKNKSYNDLSNAFYLNYKKLKKKVLLLKDQAYKTDFCENYLFKIVENINKFNIDPSEKNAIATLHLFYCLDEELSKLENFSHIIESFKFKYNELEKKIMMLKEQGVYTKESDLTLLRIRKQLKLFQVTGLEKDAIETLHLFYRLEDQIKFIEENINKIQQENILTKEY